MRTEGSTTWNVVANCRVLGYGYRGSEGGTNEPFNDDPTDSNGYVRPPRFSAVD